MVGEVTSTQEIIFNLTGQTLVVEVDRPITAATCTVYRLDADDTSTAEAATTGSAAVDSTTEVTTVAGELGGKTPPAPPPKSWASRGDTDVAIWTLRLEAGAKWTLPPARHPDAIRVLYFFLVSSLRLGDR